MYKCTVWKIAECFIVNSQWYLWLPLNFEGLNDFFLCQAKKRIKITYCVFLYSLVLLTRLLSQF